MDSLLVRLNRWYLAQCDGDWVHQSGISIETLDNPGWVIKVNLAGTNLKRRPFSPQIQGLKTLPDGLEHPAAKNWHSIRIQGDTFLAAGDPSKLEILLQVFLDWAEAA